MTKTRNYYLADPCFILILEKAFKKPQRCYSLEELEQYHMIWKDGISMGRYCELTKDAEGS